MQIVAASSFATLLNEGCFVPFCELVTSVVTGSRVVCGAAISAGKARRYPVPSKRGNEAPAELLAKVLDEERHAATGGHSAIALTGIWAIFGERDQSLFDVQSRKNRDFFVGQQQRMLLPGSRSEDERCDRGSRFRHMRSVCRTMAAPDSTPHTDNAAKNRTRTAFGLLVTWTGYSSLFVILTNCDDVDAIVVYTIVWKRRDRA